MYVFSSKKGGVSVSLKKEIQDEIYCYCNNHLPKDAWYANEFDFIADENLRKRLIEEFKGIRFAYKFYEGIEAKKENFIFQVRHQIFTYATIYEAVIHSVLFTYYNDSPEFQTLLYHTIPKRISIPSEKQQKLEQALTHDGKKIIPYYMDCCKRDEQSIRFDEKCKTAEKLGLLHSIVKKDGKEIDIVKDIIEIFSYRNGIHLIAEQRKGIEYELALSRRAYQRMRPFIDQIKDKLRTDKKGFYANN